MGRKTNIQNQTDQIKKENNSQEKINNSFKNNVQDSKLKKQKITLLIVLIIGIFLIGLSFWYRSINKSKIADDNENIAFQDFKFSKEIDLMAPVAIEELEYTKDRINGRIIDNRTNKKEQEKLIKINSQARWLAFLPSEAQKIFIKRTKFKINIDFILDTIEYISITKTDNPLIYLLKARINLLSKESFPEIKDDNNLNIDTNKNDLQKTEENNKIKEIEEEEKEFQVKIKNTPTGWLNVRKGPGTNYEIIIKVYPDEIYSLIKKENNWFNIKLSNDQSGWAYGNYIDEINNK